MRSSALKFGAFAVVSIMVLVVLANTMNNRVGGSSRTYEADFASVSGLRTGDDVRAAGVKVGRVEHIGLHANSRARVRFTLSSAQPLYDTTRMVVRYQNLLGQRYLSLLRGPDGGRHLADGSLVPESRTDPGFDLTALLNGFEPLFSSIEPDQVNQLASSIISVLQGEGGTVESLLSETATLADHLADKDEVLGQVLDNLTPVLENLASHGSELDTTIDDLGSLMTRLAQERTSIGDSIDGIGELSRATSSLIEEARPDLGRDVTALRRTSALFADTRKELAAAFETLPLTSGAFARPMSYGTWLNMHICNMGTELDGHLVNFGSPAGPYSAVCR